MMLLKRQVLEVTSGTAPEEEQNFFETLSWSPSDDDIVFCPDPDRGEVVVDTAQDSVEAYLAKEIKTLKGVEAIFVSQDPEFLRISVVINEPSVDIEDPIYNKYMALLDTLPRIATDLTVLYRCNRSLDEIQPEESHQV